MTEKDALAEAALRLTQQANNLLDEAIEKLCTDGALPDDIMLLNMPEEQRKMCWRVLTWQGIAVYEVFVERDHIEATLVLVGRGVTPDSDSAMAVRKALAEEREADKPLVVL